MKKISVPLVMLAASLLFCASCMKQSVLDADAIPGRAVVYGQLSCIYDIPQVKVYVDIDNSSLFPEASGITTYETRTDVYGNYSIEVPATERGVQVTVRADDFVDGYDWENATVYRLEGQLYATVKPGQIERVDGRFEPVNDWR